MEEEEGEERKVSHMNGSDHLQRAEYEEDLNVNNNQVEEDHFDGNGNDNLNENSPIGMLINDYLSMSQGSVTLFDDFSDSHLF
jgi:hypothetical protein